MYNLYIYFIGAADSALEKRLSQSEGPFLNGPNPTKEDHETYESIKNSNELGLKGKGWYELIGAFSKDTRSRW